MADPLVSIIIPTFNRAQCVRRALDSVFAQTFRDFEVVVVDDGSTDDTVEILKSYGAQIRLLCQPNGGASAARNTGLQAARGKWIAFLDSDDQWRPEKLAVQWEFALKYGATVCFSRCVAETGEWLPDLEEVTSTLKEPGVHHVADPVEFLSRARSHPYLQSLLLEKAWFARTGFFDTTLSAGEDTAWLLRLAHLTDCIYVDRPLTTIFRGSDNSLTYDVRPAAAAKRADARIRMQAEIYWRLRQTRPQQAGISRGRLGYVIICRAELAAVAGEFSRARALAWDALTFAPGFKFFLRTLALLLVPSLMQTRLRKKWPRQ